MRGALPDLVRKRLDPDQSYGLRVTLFALALLLVGIPFSFLLVQVTSEGALVETDIAIADSLNEVFHANEALVDLATLLSFLGSPPWFYITIGAAALYFWRKEHRRLSVYLVVTNLMGGAIDTVVKVLVDRPRPEVAHPLAHAFGKSFPSGHSMSSTVGYGSLLLVFMPVIPRRWRIPAILSYLVLVGLIMASRLGLGVHYVSDVLGGFALGLAWLAAATAAFSIWRVERGKPKVEVIEGASPESIPEPLKHD